MVSSYQQIPSNVASNSAAVSMSSSQHDATTTSVTTSGSYSDLPQQQQQQHQQQQQQQQHQQQIGGGGGDGDGNKPATQSFVGLESSSSNSHGIPRSARTFDDADVAATHHPALPPSAASSSNTLRRTNSSTSRGSNRKMFQRSYSDVHNDGSEETCSLINNNGMMPSNDSNSIMTISSSMNTSMNTSMSKSSNTRGSVNSNASGSRHSSSNNDGSSIFRVAIRPTVPRRQSSSRRHLLQRSCSERAHQRSRSADESSIAVAEDAAHYTSRTASSTPAPSPPRSSHPTPPSDSHENDNFSSFLVDGSWADDDDDDDEYGLNLSRYQQNRYSDHSFASSAGSPSAAAGQQYDPQQQQYTIQNDGSFRSGNTDATMPQQQQYHSNITCIGILHWCTVRRDNARRRRTVRLLSMPRDDVYYRTQSCILTWCDDTDIGIFVVGVWVVLWVVVGVYAEAEVLYWSIGSLLFLLRVLVRPVYEQVMDRVIYQRRRRQRRTQQQQRNASYRQRMDSIEYTTTTQETVPSNDAGADIVTTNSDNEHHTFSSVPSYTDSDENAAATTIAMKATILSSASETAATASNGTTTTNNDIKETMPSLNNGIV